MKNKRPRIKIPLSEIDFILEFITILAFVGLIVYAVINFIRLPNVIPIHFNINGQIDGYGDKTNILILLPVIFIVYLISTVLTHFPHIYNYVIPITAENAEKQYTLAVHFMRVLKLELVLLLTYVEVAMVASVVAGKLRIEPLFIPVMFIVLLGTTGVYIYQSIRNR